MDESVKEKVEKFFTRFEKLTFHKQELIIHADKQPKGIYYLQEGTVKQYSISKKGEELVVNMFKPISFFPMSWAMNNTENIYYYQAITPVTTFLAPKDAVIVFMKQEHDVIYNLLRRVYQGTDGLLMKITYLMAGNAYDRLLVELITHAKRFGKKEGGTVSLVITENELASQTGMSRETISRMIKLLKERGLLSINRNNIIIPDVNLLGKELERMT